MRVFFCLSCIFILQDTVGHNRTEHINWFNLKFTWKAPDVGVGNVTFWLVSEKAAPRISPSRHPTTTRKFHSDDRVGEMAKFSMQLFLQPKIWPRERKKERKKEKKKGRKEGRKEGKERKGKERKKERKERKKQMIEEERTSSQSLRDNSTIFMEPSVVFTIETLFCTAISGRLS